MRVRRLATWGCALLVGVPAGALLAALAWMAARDETNGRIVVDGQEREYLLHVPASYDRAGPAPLVVSLHAGAVWPAHQRDLSGWSRLADEHGFLVVYPAGTPMPVVRALTATPKMWHTFETGADLERDVRFLAALLDRLQAEHAIDPTRIFADGMSNGGGMAYALSCALPERIAAVGVVGGAQTLPAEWCANAPPTPVMAFHGDADTFVPYAGGPLGDPFNPVKPVFAPVRTWMARWAARNRCDLAPVESALGREVSRLDYRDCAGGADVVLFTVVGGGHSWPGGEPPPEWRVGKTSTAIDATAALWEFYGEHPLTRR
jgi:polyhydroxybutyrate depolymerase